MTTTLDFSQCLQKASNWGETVFTNVCSGAISHVPWGTMDYVGCSVLLGLGVLAIAIMIGLVYAIIEM